MQEFLSAPSPATPDRRIKVLHSVGHLLRGGIETWLHKMIEQLDNSAYEHHVLVYTEDEEAFTEQFRDCGAKILPCLSHHNPLSFTRNLNALMRRNGPYDVVHTHGTHFHALVLMLAKRHGVETRIAHSHTDIRPVLSDAGPLYRAYAALGNYGIKRYATRGLAASHLAAESLFGKQWADDARWQLLYYGIDFEPFCVKPDTKLRTDLGIPEDRFVIGHVGRFELQKNHEFLLAVAPELVHLQPDVHFLLVGDGNLRSKFIASLKQKGLSDRFSFLPDCTSVPLHMVSAMDAFIFPSLYEGLGLAAVEAQAAGLPCVISDQVPVEAIVDTHLVQQLPLGDPKHWAEAFLSMPDRVEHPNRQFLSQFSRSRFSLSRSVNGLASAYRNREQARFTAGNEMAIEQESVTS